MSSSNPLQPEREARIEYRYTFSAFLIDSTGYYVPKFFSKVTVQSDAHNGAFDKALAALGKPQQGREWRLDVEDISGHLYHECR